MPICPSCGQPARVGLYHRRMNSQVKQALVLGLLGYVVLSILLLGISTPREMRRGCGTFDSRLQIPYITPDPNRCKDTEFTLWLKPLTRQPVLQAFVAGGLITGVLLFYWDGLQKNYENWQKKREATAQKHGKTHAHQCRRCGRQWN